MQYDGVARFISMFLVLGAAACDGAGDMSPGETGDAAVSVDSGVIISDQAKTMVAVGDIADCASPHDEETAALVAAIEGPVLVLGDLAYEEGSAEDFANCYDPAWGEHKARTHPVPGNHEYDADPDANPYFDYFGAAAGERGKGYYSFDVGAWHIVALNTNIDMTAGSEQAAWLRDDLAAHDNACTLAFMHYPRFSSGLHGDLASVKPLWDELYAHGVDVVLAGHDHHYERFAPQDPLGNADPQGIRELVVGTGGRYLRDASGQRNTEAVNDETHGVLKLALDDDAYAWEFVPVAGSSFSDRGSARCR